MARAFLARREGWAWAGIFVLALAVRLGYVAADGRGAAELHDDATQYHGYALSLLERGEYRLPDGDLAARAPGYPLFLAALYAFAGPSVPAAQAAQAVLGAAACLVLGAAAARVVRREWALACAAAAALHQGLVFPTPRLLSEALAILALSALLWTWLAASERARAPLCGLLVGAAHLIRPELGVLAPVFAGLESLRARGARGPLVVLACFFAVVAPWGLRNKAALDRFLLTSNLGGKAFFVSVHGPLVRLGEEAAAPEPPPGLGELEESDWYRARALERLRWEPPARLLKGWLVQALELFYPFLPGYDATLLLLAPLWLWCLARPGLARRAAPAAAAFLVLTLVYVLFGSSGSRMRQVLAPCLVLMAAVGAQDLWDKRRGLFAAGFGAWAALHAAIWLWAPQARELALGLKARLL